MKPIGPYSLAVRAGNFLFVSGQIHPHGDIQNQTLRVLDQIETILVSHNLSLKNVVKTEVYLSDLDNFAAMNAIYAARFTDEPQPARQAMQVARLPQDALIEISCIAYLG